MNKLNILGVHLSTQSMEDTFRMAIDFLDGEEAHAIYTPNPEIIYEAYHDPAYRDVLNRADMLIPDGIGVVYASRILRQPMPERVPGYDLTIKLLEHMATSDKCVYILGGKPGVAETAATNMEVRFPGLKFAGVHDGYFKDDAPIIDEINRLKPDLLLVCLGAPKQENWIDMHRDKLSVHLAIGAGGSVDVMAGTAKRAPEFFIRCNLEWFYRLLKEPSRIGRMMRLPKFIWTVLLHGRKFLKKENETC